MPIGAANLFSATDPKLAVYDYATSFFGGVAPLVSYRNCYGAVCVDHCRTLLRQRDQSLIAVLFCCKLLRYNTLFMLLYATSTTRKTPSSLFARHARGADLGGSSYMHDTLSRQFGAGSMDWVCPRMLLRGRFYRHHSRSASQQQLPPSP